MKTEPQDSAVIKNPNRNNSQIPEPYIPEHVRLGRAPIIQDFSSLDGDIIGEETTSLPTKPTENVSYTPKVGEFILMVLGKVISHGNEQQILSEAKSILYKENPNFINSNISIDDIVILKRIGLKVGIFFNE